MTRYPGAGSFLPDHRTLDTMADAVQRCRGCDLYQKATQAVFGDGPAGRHFDRGLEAAGIDRRRVYATNAVKHFRFTAERGKRRIHQSQTASQITACRPWLVSEIAGLRLPLDGADLMVATVHPIANLRSDRREEAVPGEGRRPCSRAFGTRLTTPATESDAYFADEGVPPRSTRAES